MRLIKGRKAEREERDFEEMFRFPAVQEIWEVSCASREDRKEIPNSQKAVCRTVAVGSWKLEA
jgi:hypothetical protein